MRKIIYNHLNDITLNLCGKKQRLNEYSLKLLHNEVAIIRAYLSVVMKQGDIDKAKHKLIELLYGGVDFPDEAGTRMLHDAMKNCMVMSTTKKARRNLEWFVANSPACEKLSQEQTHELADKYFKDMCHIRGMLVKKQFEQLITFINDLS